MNNEQTTRVPPKVEAMSIEAMQARAAIERDRHDRKVRAIFAFVQMIGFFALLGALLYLVVTDIPGAVDDWLKGVLGPLIGLQARATYEAVSFYYQSSAGSKAKDK